MKRSLYILLLLAFLFGCSNETAPDNGENNINENGNQNETQEGNDVQEENTYIDQEVVEAPTEIHVGKSAFFVYPETGYSEENKIEFIVHGIDYLSDIDIEGPSQNENYDFLVLDFEIKNTGEYDIRPRDHYPNLMIHNSSGHKIDVSLANQKIKSQTLDNAELIPGGHSRGLAVIPLEEGEEIDSLFFDTKTYFSEKNLPAFELNLDDVSKLATETATQTLEALELQREAYITDHYKDYDSQTVSLSSSLGNAVISNFEAIGLITEPKEIRGGGLNGMHSIDFLAEFIRDENDRIIGVRFTEQ